MTNQLNIDFCCSFTSMVFVCQTILRLGILSCKTSFPCFALGMLSWKNLRPVILQIMDLQVHGENGNALLNLLCPIFSFPLRGKSFLIKFVQTIRTWSFCMDRRSINFPFSLPLLGKSILANTGADMYMKLLHTSNLRLKASVSDFYFPSILPAFVPFLKIKGSHHLGYIYPPKSTHSLSHTPRKASR